MSTHSRRTRPYSVKEFADKFGFRRTTVYYWVRHGHVKSTRIGGTILIHAEEAERLAPAFAESA